VTLHPVVILAGGLATRLYPLTEEIPKVLLKVGGQYFIAHQLRLLRARGIERVVISTWHHGEMIRDYVRDGRDFELQVDYVFDGEMPLGTGGAVRQALTLLDGPFFVLYGDSYLPCDLAAIQAFFDGHSKVGLMTVYHNYDRWDTSNVELRDGAIVRYDKANRDAKMKHIDYGLGLFHPRAFDHLIEGQPADLADVYQRLLAEGNLLAYEVGQRFYEIGSFEGLKELDALLSEQPDRFLRKE